MQIPLTLGLVITAFTLSACTSNKPDQTVPRFSAVLSEVTGQNGRACVRISDIRSYGTRDRGRVITINARRKYYAATTLYRCSEIDFSHQALFDGNFHEICGNSTSYIIAGGERCPIHKVFEFENRESATDAINQAAEKRESIKAAIKAEKASKQ